LGLAKLAMLFELRHCGASNVSTAEYKELKRLHVKGSGRGLFSDRISVLHGRLEKAHGNLQIG
jgi:hypothetical protein